MSQPKTPSPLAKWLFDNGIDLVEGGKLFRCSHEQLRRIRDGVRPAKGKTAELILAVSTNRLTLDDLRVAAGVLPCPSAQPAPDGVPEHAPSGGFVDQGGA